MRMWTVSLLLRLWLLPSVILVAVDAGLFGNAKDKKEQQQQQSTGVPDLDVYNLESTILAHNWTCVVFYDGLDETQCAQNDQMLRELVTEFSNEHHPRSRFDLGFATLDVRRHPLYRRAYEFPKDENPFIYNFYRDFPEFETPVVLQPRTFMNMRGDVYFPSSVVLFGHDFNVYARVNLNANYNADLAHKIDLVANWLETLTPSKAEEVMPHVLSPANEERKTWNKDRDNTFNFEKYHAYMELRENISNDHNNNNSDNKLGAPQKYLTDIKNGNKNKNKNDNDNNAEKKKKRSTKIILERDGTITRTIVSDDSDSHDDSEDEEGNDNDSDEEHNEPVSAPKTQIPEADQVRFLLEAGAKHNANLDEQGAFRFTRPKMEDHEHRASTGLLRELVDITMNYLIWCEAYEDLWDDDRRKLEDEKTKYGVHLRQMNADVHKMIQEVFDPGYIAQRRKQQEPKLGDEEPVDEKQERLDLGLTMRQWNARKRKLHFKNDKIPVELKNYLQELVMDIGRSPKRVREYFYHNMSEPLGKTPAQRRAARKTLGGSIAFSLVERMRDYMYVWSDVSEDGERYKSVLRLLVLRWHNIVIDFHNRLTISYQAYLEEHPEDPGNSGTFPLQPMDVLDMEDPDDAKVLSNYKEFSRRYTEAGIPVILDHVNMTNHEWTLEYLVEKCGPMDVTRSVRWSNPVGAKSGKGWGGLKDYQLHVSLMNEPRKTRRDPDEGDRQASSESASVSMSEDEIAATEAFLEENDDSDVIKYDRSLTFEQFAILSAELPELYLHDYSMPKNCGLMFHENTAYDEEQTFRLPFVIGAYDYFQRLPLLGWTQSWPSLFVGKKGSNSKLHIDAGASGFFMYLVKGRKRWVVYNRSERPYLYEDQPRFIPDVLGMGKSAEANEFLSKRFPLLNRAAAGGYEIIQQPGQLVWIPPNCPHAVENLDDIIGIAMNMIPQFGFGEYLHDAIHCVRRFDEIEQLLKYMMFQDHADEPFPSEDPLYSTFAEYKGQW